MAPSTVTESSDASQQAGTESQHDRSSAPSQDAAGSVAPTTTTDVDNPSHPLYRHRRTVADFEYGAVLGEGSYSTVLVAKDLKTGKDYAVKKLDKAHIVKNDKVKYVMIERDALSKMNHPGIVRLYWTFKDNRSLYYVLDLARNGELYTYIRRLAPFDMDTARFYAAEILLAIEHIHSRGVVHRDIKPENILLDDKLHIKVTDFGSAKILQPEEASKPDENDGNAGRSRSFVGTAEYVSPELLRSEPTLKEADLWALGCVIYQMHVGRSPFKAATDYLIFQKIKNLDLTFPDDFPDVAKDLVQKLLVLEPEQRLGSEATGGMDALKRHPYFEGVDWEQIWESQAPPLKERLDAKLQKTRPTHTDAVDENEFDLWFRDEERVDHNPFSDQQASKNVDDDDDDDDDDEDEDGSMYNKYGVRGPAAVAVRRYPSGATSTPPEDIASTSSAGMTPGHTRNSSSYSSTPERLGEQSHPPWIAHLYPNESIIRAGRVARKRGLFNKKRFLILTDRPRLLYLDEGSAQDGSGGTLRCEIAWTADLLPELKTKSVFCIHTPQKLYTFEDSKGRAQDWVNTINSMLVDSFGVTA